MELRDKLISVVNTECEYAEKHGSSILSVCNHSNWDKDLWNYKETIIDAIRKRGYNVSSATNHGVLDITTTKKINLSE